MSTILKLARDISMIVDNEICKGFRGQLSRWLIVFKSLDDMISRRQEFISLHGQSYSSKVTATP
jgi:hypothetical protein